MSLRSWAIRGLILAGVALLAALGWLANSWVSPERVRAQVIAHLTEQFEGVDVHVGSAHMRILGGIAVADVKLSRPGAGRNRNLVARIPSAILYHDKEQLNRGRLVIKKVELENPELHLERGPDGKWNIAEVLKQAPADKPVPTFVIKGGTIHITDRGPDPLPSVTLTDAHLTLLNDPLPILSIQARGTAKGYGVVNARARVNRLSGGLSLGLEMPDVPARRSRGRNRREVRPGPRSAHRRADRHRLRERRPQLHPGRREEVAARYPARPEGRALHAPGHPVAGREDHRVRAPRGRTRYGEGRHRPDRRGRCQLVAGNAPWERETRNPKPEERKTPVQQLEDQMQHFDLSVTGVPLDDNLFKHLPDKAKQARRMFSPTGQVDVGYKFTREGGGWKRELEVRPKQIAMAYEKFQYPVADVRGWVKRTTTHAGASDDRDRPDRHRRRATHHHQG